MKILLTINCALISTFLLGQFPLAKKSYERYNADRTRWETPTIQTWQYDNLQRPIIETWWNENQGPFQPYNNRVIETFYNQLGQINLIKHNAWGDTISMERTETFFFDVNNEVREIIINSTYSNGSSSGEKSVFDKDPAQNRRTKKEYHTLGSLDNWILDHQRDSFFDGSGNLTKQTILNFEEEGTKHNERWWTYNYSAENHLEEEGYWLTEADTDSLFLFSRQFYSYAKAGREMTRFYEKLSTNSGEWKPQYTVIEEVDTIGRLIHYLYENYKISVTDTVEKHYTFTEKGEPLTFRELKTNHFNSEQSLAQVRYDSTAYHYDDDEKLLLKEEFIFYHNNPPRKVSTYYQYYCNGLLKTELREELPQVSRINYEYYGNADCPLTENEVPGIQIYPNPSDGIFTIQSNLLLTEEVKIQVIDIAGKTVFEQDFDLISHQALMKLPELIAGYYVVIVENKEKRISEKLVIHK